MTDNDSTSAKLGLASYLSQMQLQIIMEREASPARIQPYLQEHSGAVLLIDISGFTELTQQFEQRGTRGIEDFSVLLKSYFGLLTEIIMEHDGDIVSFAGDAVLAAWTTDEPSNLVAMLFQSVRAAKAIQDKLKTWGAPFGVALHQRFAVGAGTLAAMELGGTDGRWQFLLSGQPIIDAAEGTKLADSGDIILSPAAWQLVSSRSKGTPLSSGYIRLEGLENSTARLSGSSRTLECLPALDPFVIPIVANRIKTGHGAWLAEFRSVTVVFVQLSDSCSADSPRCAQLHSAVNAVLAVLSHFEGCLYQFLMDDKGIVLIAVFGLPPLAHEDDAERGIESAVAMHRELASHGFDLSIGITTGRAFCCVLGTPTRQQYTAVGTAMNLAARLMEIGNGQIICDEATFRSVSARRSLSFQQSREITIKGQKEPVTIYSLEACRSKTPSGGLEGIRVYRSEPLEPWSAPAAAMVGRDIERAILCEALQTLVQEKQGATLVIEGEPGIGKSRLIEYVLNEARAKNVRFVSSAGDSIRRNSPYYAWQEVFRSLFQLDSQSDLRAQRDQVAAELRTQPELYKRLPLLSGVLQLDFPDNELTSQMTGKVRLENTLNALAQLLEHLTASEPHLLVLEDVHWLDSSSLTLATFVASHLKQLLVVVSTRPFAPPVPGEYELLIAICKNHIRLTALSREDTLTIAARWIGVQSLPEAVAEFLQRRAAGHPFFVQELVRALSDSGLIKTAGEQCTPAWNSSASIEDAFSELHIPSTIQGLITSRVDRLLPRSQLVLKTASVIGRTFTLPLLQTIVPKESDTTRLVEDLQHLEMLNLIERIPIDADTWEFNHAITQEVVYSSLAFALRRNLHRSIAEWHEKHYDRNLTSYYPLLAHHWRQAEVRPKAIDYAAKAARQAIHSFANPEAVHFLQEALTLHREELEQAQDRSALVSDQDRAQWRIWLGKALFNIGKTTDAKIQIEQGLSGLKQPIPKTLLGAILALLSQATRQILHRFAAKWDPPRTGKNRDLILEASRGYQGLMEIYYLQNAPLFTLAASLKALNLAEIAGSSPELARGYASLGAILGFIPLHNSAQAYFNRALQTALDADDLQALGWVSLCKGIYHAGVGNWDDASQLFEKMQTICNHLGDEKNAGDAFQCLGMVEYFRGNFQSSLRFTAQFRTAVVRSKNHHLEAESLRWKAYNLLGLGQLKELANCVQQLECVRSEHKGANILNLADVFALQAAFHLCREEYILSFQAIHEAADRLSHTSNTTHELILERSLIAEIYLRIWEQIQSGLSESEIGESAAVNVQMILPQCHRGAALACKALRKFTRIFPIGQPITWLWSGLHSYLEGHAKDAFAAWGKSVHASQKLAMPYAEGLTEYEIGRHLPDNTSGRIHLGRAHDIFTHLNAAYNLAQTDRAVQILELKIRQ